MTAARPRWWPEAGPNCSRGKSWVHLIAPERATCRCFAPERRGCRVDRWPASACANDVPHPRRLGTLAAAKTHCRPGREPRCLSHRARRWVRLRSYLWSWSWELGRRRRWSGTLLRLVRSGRPTQATTRLRPTMRWRAASTDWTKRAAGRSPTTASACSPTNRPGTKWIRTGLREPAGAISRTTRGLHVAC